MASGPTERWLWVVLENQKWLGWRLCSSIMGEQHPTLEGKPGSAFCLTFGEELHLSETFMLTYSFSAVFQHKLVGRISQASKKDLVRMLAQSLPQKQHQEIKNAGRSWTKNGSGGSGLPTHSRRIKLQSSMS